MEHKKTVKRIQIIQTVDVDSEIDKTGVEIDGFTPEEVLFIFELIKKSLIEKKTLELAQIEKESKDYEREPIE